MLGPPRARFPIWPKGSCINWTGQRKCRQCGAFCPTRSFEQEESHQCTIGVPCDVCPSGPLHLSSSLLDHFTEIDEHTHRRFPTNRHFTFLTKRNLKNTASFELNTIKYFLYSYFFHYNLAQGEWAKKINSGSDLNVLKMIWTDTADPYLFALVIKRKRNPFCPVHPWINI